MTTFFSSKESALQQGIYYARGKTDLKIDELKKIGCWNIDQFGSGQEAEIYEFKNEKDENVQVGVSNTPRGWNLWLLAKNGVTLRV